MAQPIRPADLDALIGQPLGVSEWLQIDQPRIAAFADVTEDHQFIHVDPERASHTRFGGTIAHGLLSLSLLPRLCAEFVPRIDGTTLLLNYGFNRVRFPAPVREGTRVRARGRLSAVELRRRGQYILTLEVNIEMENYAKPAVIADWLSIHIVGHDDV